MKVVIVVVHLLLSFKLAWSQQVGQQVFMKLESGEFATIYKQPGVNWKYCERDKSGACKDAIGWPDKDTKVWIAGKKVKVKTRDPFTEQEVEEEYYPVQFEYSRKGPNGVIKKSRGPIGYIDSAYLDTVKRKAIYESTAKSESQKRCDPKAKSDRKQNEELKEEIELSGLDKTAKLVKEKIGFCALDKLDHEAKGNVYDNLILPKIQNTKLPNVRDEKENKISNDQLISIDSLARTLYGEMASCFKHGLEYPMAVARIIVNRSESPSQKKLFIKGSHDSDKSDISKVATTSSQFVLWLKKLNGENNPPLKMAVCPPRSSSEPMWNGHKPSPYELKVWGNSVKIATEAVLFPTKFKSRTKDLENRFYYTGGMDKFYGMKQDTVTIEGRTLNKPKCVQIWHEDG